MKCTSISARPSGPGDDDLICDFGKFVKSDLAKSNFGRLLVELIEESVWTEEFEVSASFGGNSFLTIRHKAFLPDCPLTLYDDGTIWSVNKVEEEVREHLRISEKTAYHEIEILLEKITAMQGAAAKIATNKAKAAVIEAFPEVRGTGEVIDVKYGLCAFASPTNKRSTFVARLVGDKPVGGVARIKITPFEWKQTKDGTANHERFGMFCIALAKAFAARELHGLGITEEDLDTYHAGIIIQENPRMEQKDPYIVRKILLRRTSAQDITIVFGSDNLPAKMICELE